LWRTRSQCLERSKDERISAGTYPKDETTVQSQHVSRLRVDHDPLVLSFGDVRLRHFHGEFIDRHSGESRNSHGNHDPISNTGISDTSYWWSDRYLARMVAKGFLL